MACVESYALAFTLVREVGREVGLRCAGELMAGNDTPEPCTPRPCWRAPDAGRAPPRTPNCEWLTDDETLAWLDDEVGLSPSPRCEDREEDATEEAREEVADMGR